MTENKAWDPSEPEPREITIQLGEKHRAVVHQFLPGIMVSVSFEKLESVSGEDERWLQNREEVILDIEAAEKIAEAMLEVVKDMKGTWIYQYKQAQRKRGAEAKQRKE
jgi:hypothetical protein